MLNTLFIIVASLAYILFAIDAVLMVYKNDESKDKWFLALTICAAIICAPAAWLASALVYGEEA